MTQLKEQKEIRVTEMDLLKTESGLTVAQIQKFFTKTPKDKIKRRPAKGGGYWDYVEGSYVTLVLNSLFGFDWEFKVLTDLSDAFDVATKTGVVTVLGSLKVPVGDKYITKQQWGSKEVAFKKGTKDPLNFGNDMKAATTDAKKKCASELGLFADVYSQDNFFEAEVVEGEIVPEQTEEDFIKETKEAVGNV